MTKVDLYYFSIEEGVQSQSLPENLWYIRTTVTLFGVNESHLPAHHRHGVAST